MRATLPTDFEFRISAFLKRVWKRFAYGGGAIFDIVLSHFPSGSAGWRNGSRTAEVPFLTLF